MATKRVPLFGVQMHALRMPEAIELLRSWVSQERTRCRYVVTPNVDHVVLLRESPQFRAVYRDADLVLADGWPVVAASRLLRRPLPERVPGSELVPQLFAATRDNEKLSVYLLGAMPGVGERAAENIHRRWPNVRVTGTYSPPLGFEKSDGENELILSRIAEACPDILIVGLGAPKQELWVHRFRDRLPAKVVLCVGATIDFLAGEKKRAPRWVQSIGMEWLHRMASEPRRLVGRYARDAWIFPQLIWHEWRNGPHASQAYSGGARQAGR